MSGRAVLSKAERTACWQARDGYFQCLNTHGDEASCAAELKGLMAACPAAWVSHFKKTRLKELYRRKLAEEGFKALDEDQS